MIKNFKQKLLFSSILVFSLSLMACSKTEQPTTTETIVETTEVTTELTTEIITTEEIVEPTKIEKAYDKYKEEYENAEYRYMSKTSFVTIEKYYDGSSIYYLTHIIIDSPSQIKGALSYDDWGGTRELATDVSTRLNAIITTNGSYFSYDTGCPVTCSVYIKNGEILVDGVTNGKEVCLKEDGTLFSPNANITANELLNQGVVDIWGTADPLLIQNGELQEIVNDKSYPRCAYGMVEPCEYYIITAGENNYETGLTFKQLQDRFANLGCTFARSLDGGGSATLVFEDVLMNQPSAGQQRPVVDFIYFTD